MKASFAVQLLALSGEVLHGEEVTSLWVRGWLYSDIVDDGAGALCEAPTSAWR